MKLTKKAVGATNKGRATPPGRKTSSVSSSGMEDFAENICSGMLSEALSKYVLLLHCGIEVEANKS